MDSIEAASFRNGGGAGVAAAPDRAVPVCEPVESPSPLDALIGLLQGSTERLLADAGIAGQGRHRLDLIAVAAGQESETCLDRMRCLLALMDAGLATDPPALARGSLVSATRHLARLLADFERWHSLAGNAAYYRDHPQVAAKVAQKWREATGA